MKKILLFFMIVVLSFCSLTACGGANNNGNGTGNNDGREDVSFADEYFINAGKSDYVIVVPDSPTEIESFAIGELVNFTYLATGCKLEFVYDSDEMYRNAEKFVSIGKTSRLEKSGVQVTKADLKSSGFVIKTVNDAIYIAGAEDMGTMCGIYEFLDQLFDFRVYAEDEIYYETVSSLKMPIFNVKYNPSFDERIIPDMRWTGSASYVYRLRMKTWNKVSISIAGDNATLGKTLVPPSTYLEGHRLSDYPNNYYIDNEGIEICFSNPEVWDIMVEGLKVAFTENRNQNRVLLGQQDGLGWCACPRCKEIIKQYGDAEVVTAIQCANYVEEKLNEWGKENGDERTFITGVFAYLETQEAPVIYDEKKDEFIPLIKTNPNVFVLFAPIHMDYAVPIYHEDNEQYEELLRSWDVVTERLYLWSYGTNFQDYLVDFANWSGGFYNYEFYEENGVDLLFEQGRGYHVEGTDFQTLRYYLTSQLSYDNSQNMDVLIKDWFEHYFKGASEKVYKYFDELLDLGQYNIKAKGMSIWGPGLINKEFWPRASLLRWQGYLDEAKTEIADLAETDLQTYLKLIDRIDKESIMIRYLLIKFHGDYYTNTELYDKKVELKTIVEKFNMNLYGEPAGRNFEQLFAEWGL